MKRRLSIYDSLVSLSSSLNTSVYETSADEGNGYRAQVYHSSSTGHYSIYLHKSCSKEPLLKEVVLSHEIGHVIVGNASQAHWRPNIENQNWKAQLSCEEKLFIYLDELAAWQAARRILESIGFTEWKFFEETMKGDLGQYREYLYE